MRCCPPGSGTAHRSSRRLVADAEFALGVETIYEGYLLHYGRPRLFAPPTATSRSSSVTRCSPTGSSGSPRPARSTAVADLAELLSLCAQARGDGLDGDGAAWAATSALLGRGGLDDARAALRDARDPAPLERLARATVGDDPVDGALAAHAARLV